MPLCRLGQAAETERMELPPHTVAPSCTLSHNDWRRGSAALVAFLAGPSSERHDGGG